MTTTRSSAFELEAIPGLSRAFSELGIWQRKVTDHKYTDPPKKAKPIERFEDQKELIKSALTSSNQYTATIRQQVGQHLSEKFLAQLPSLPQRLMPHEFANPTFQTDKCIHRALMGQGCRRDLASKWAFWHLVTLKAVSEGMTANPPAFLLQRNYTGNLPMNQALIDDEYAQSNEDDRKKLDATVRNLLRHSGGIFHRRSNYLIDAALPAAWWRIEIAHLAADTDCGLDEAKIYQVLKESWKEWAPRAAWSATRLAAPNAAAAFAIAAYKHQSKTGTLPRGDKAKEIILMLLRRTMHLSVTHVSPQDLAELVA